MLVPTIVDSDYAEFSTRPGNSVLKPRVTPKTSPFKGLCIISFRKSSPCRGPWAESRFQFPVFGVCD